MALINTGHKFFKPLWVRILTVAFSFGWAIVEFASGELVWAILFAGFALFSAYEFFIAFEPDDNDDT